MPSGFVGPGIIAFSMIDPTPYSGATWTIADGKAISRIAFPILFAAFGTLYGPGDGSTTYNIPDLRGRTPIATAPAGLAWSAAAKTVGNGYGEETVTLAATQIPSHTHGAGTLAAASAGGKSVAATALLLLSSGPNIAQGPAGTGTPYQTADAHTHTISGTTGAAGAGAAHDNLPPLLCCGDWWLNIG